jgi:hypothetical protein
MAKKQTTQKRTKVEDLPRKGKKLSAGDMKKVKGGTTGGYAHGVAQVGLGVAGSGGDTKPPTK